MNSNCKNWFYGIGGLKINNIGFKEGYAFIAKVGEISEKILIGNVILRESVNDK